MHLSHHTNLHQNTNVLIIILIKAAGADGISTFRENFEELLWVNFSYSKITELLSNLVSKHLEFFLLHWVNGGNV